MYEFDPENVTQPPKQVPGQTFFFSFTEYSGGLDVSLI